MNFLEEKKLLKRNKLLNPSSENKKLFYIIYTALFCVMAVGVFYYIIKGGYSFIQDEDGFKQHYKSLVYYSEFLREVVRNIFIEHTFAVPQFDFSIGMGSDVITTLSYYVIGDPVNVLSVFVPKDYIIYYYHAMVLMRMYLSGIAFSYMCFYFGKKNWYAVLTGSMSYVFCAFSVYSCVRHPYFVSPLIYLPLIIVGIEKILSGKKIWHLAFAVCIAGLSNFYFFYILVLLTVVYVAIRLICLYYKDIKKIFAPLVKIAVSSILGVMMASVLLIPMILAFMGDNRSASENTLNLLYTWKKYIHYAAAMMTSLRGGNWIVPGTVFLCIPAIGCVLFGKSKKKTTHIGLLISIAIFLTFPVFGKIFNGFSYVCNRWSFAVALLSSYLITECWSKLIKPDKKVWIGIGALSAITALACCLDPKGDKYNVHIALAAMVIYLVIVTVNCFGFIKLRKRASQILVFLLCLVNLLGNSIYLYSPSGENYAADSMEFSSVQDYKYKADKAVIKETKNQEETFFRSSGDGFKYNSGVVTGVNTTTFYFSLSNGNISTARHEWNIRENLPYYYKGFDSRTALNELASVRYFYQPNLEKSVLPYGYVETETKNLYENEYTLPIGYTYDSYVSLDSYNALESAVAKQDAMLQGVVLEKETDFAKEIYPETESYEVGSKIITNSENITYENGTFITTEKNQTFTIKLDKAVNAETYLCFYGWDFAETSMYDLYSDNVEVDPLNLYGEEQWNELSSKKQAEYKGEHETFKSSAQLTVDYVATTESGKKLARYYKYYTPRYSFYSNRTDFELNLGYTEEGYKEVTVTLPFRGRYTFDSLKVIAQPMDDYADKVNALKQDVLENIVIDTNVVKGTISLSESKILCLSVPYSNGWTAYVNGQEQELLKANRMYCGLELAEGEYEIELRYDTPGFKLGMAVSALGWAVFIFGVAYTYKKKKTKEAVK